MAARSCRPGCWTCAARDERRRWAVAAAGPGVPMRIVAGRWRGHTIQAPPGRATRPTTDRVREAWMSAMLPLLPGATVLDLFAGSGALGLEALSRGAAHATFVEIAGGPLKALRANIERLGAADDSAVVRDDAMHYVRHLGPGSFDVAL